MGHDGREERIVSFNDLYILLVNEAEWGRGDNVGQDVG
jgi:hypothetical protein